MGLIGLNPVALASTLPLLYTCCVNDSFLLFLLPAQSYVHPTSQQALA